jgi:predicted membrane protein
LKGGESVRYKVKRGSTFFDKTITEWIGSLFKRLFVTLLLFALLAGLGFFLFRVAYARVPAFADAADQVLIYIKKIYAIYGLGATFGFIVFVCLCVWAMGEEAKRKGRQKETMNHTMK